MRYRHTTIWKEAPFIRLIIPFAGGIIIERYQQLSLHHWMPGILLLIIAWFILFCVPLHFRYYLRPAYGILINAAFFITGGLLALTQDTGLSARSFEKLYKKSDVLVLKLREPFNETKATYKTNASVYGLYRKDSFINVTGNILLYFKKDSVAAKLSDGNELLVFANPTPIQNSGNPGTFDFASYAKLKGNQMQAFVATDEYIIISDQKRAGLKQWLIDRRNAICAILKKNIPGRKESALAEALLVGYKEGLDKDLLQAYSNTGVVHVIAISGLHLGILYIIIKALLTIIPFFQNNKWITSILIVVFLWLFSLLTGGSPSVIRSAVMFTAILFGESFSRKISIYNCLAASAFILLCYKPYWIFDIGFQLSYAAVLGILVFNNTFEQLLFVKNKLLDKLWQMVTVTFAAQILTTPISLFYFHQFPNYFLFANLVAVPLSSAILIGTIFLCLISFVPILPELIGKLLTVSIRLMNDIIEHISNLPFSVTEAIYFPLPKVILLYCLIITICGFLYSNKKIFLLTAHVVLIALAVTNLYREIAIGQRQMMIVYNVKGKQVMEIINGRKGFITGKDAACIEDDCGQIIAAANTLYGVESREKITLPYCIRGEKESIGFINTKEDLCTSLHESVIIPSSQMTPDAELICRELRPALIVLDASHTYFTIQEWVAIANKLRINIHVVSSKGAFVKTLN